MKCPECKRNMRVVDSRPHKGTVRRRRECVYCEKRYNTLETFEEDLSNPVAAEAVKDEAKEIAARLNSKISELRDLSQAIKSLAAS